MPKLDYKELRIKQVYDCYCRICLTLLCRRAMKASLLTNSQVKLYSTDVPIKNAVVTFGGLANTKRCQCKVQTLACGKCGAALGYVVSRPCMSCMNAGNNGHFVIFYERCVVAETAVHPLTGQALVWDHLLSHESSLWRPQSLLMGCTADRSSGAQYEDSVNPAMADDPDFLQMRLVDQYFSNRPQPRLEAECDR